MLLTGEYDQCFVDSVIANCDAMPVMYHAKTNLLSSSVFLCLHFILQDFVHLMSICLKFGSCFLKYDWLILAGFSDMKVVKYAFGDSVPQIINF